MEARIIAQRAKAGTAVANLMNPEASKPKPTRDHLKENLARLRDLQQSNIARKMESEQEDSKQMFKLDRFKNVGSMVFQNVDFSIPEPKPKTREAGSGSRPSSVNHASFASSSAASEPYQSKKEKRLPSVPRRDDVNVLAPRTQVNFKSANARAVIDAHVHRDVEEEMAASFRKPSNYGQVPQYLKNRQAEMKAEEEMRVRAEADKDIPAGMVRMSEEERQRTLEMLFENKRQVEEDLRRMPLRIETPSMIDRQQKLLDKVKEIEDAVKVFSRSPVYITA